MHFDFSKELTFYNIKKLVKKSNVWDVKIIFTPNYNPAVKFRNKSMHSLCLAEHFLKNKRNKKECK